MGGRSLAQLGFLVPDRPGRWSGIFSIGYEMVRQGGSERLGDVRSFGPGSNRKLL